MERKREREGERVGEGEEQRMECFNGFLRTNIIANCSFLNSILQQTIQNKTEKCRCIGLSGSCSVQSCYSKSADIEIIGEQLKALYFESIEVTENEDGDLDPVNPHVTLNQENNTDLVHKGTSPSFCQSDYSKGIVGTEHRECVNSGTGSGSCSAMCCERGTYSIITEIPKECCQFVWCCRIECTQCGVDIVERFYCNP